MTLPTEAELNNEIAITNESSFEQIPLTKETIRIWKRMVDTFTYQEHSEDEIIKIIKSNPDPEDYKKPDKKWNDNKK